MFKFIDANSFNENPQKQTQSASEDAHNEIAHQINNPLAIIMACTERIRNGIKNTDVNKESLEEQIQKIEAMVMRISQTVDDLKRSHDEIPSTLP